MTMPAATDEDLTTVDAQVAAQEIDRSGIGRVLTAP